MANYPSVQAMKDALGDIVLLVRHNADTDQDEAFTYDMLPADGQLAVFRWVTAVPNLPAAKVG